MSGYIVSVIAAATVVALGGLISYGGQMARVSKAAMAMVLLYTVTLPIISVTSNLSELISSDYFEDLKVEYDDEGTLFYERTSAAFGEGVEKFVCAEFDLNADDVAVSVRGLDVESMRAEKIIVILSGHAVTSDARSIVRTVADAGLGECEVKIDLG